MVKNLFFSSLIIMSLFYLAYSSKVISINLKYYNSTDPPVFSNLYTNVKIGTPDVNIFTYISSERPLFSIFGEIGKSYEKDSKHYNTSMSTTYLNVSKIGYKVVTSDQDEHAQESFIFNFYDNKTKKYNEEKLYGIDFAFGVKRYIKTDDIYHLNIGFPIIISQSIRDKFNLIFQLKEKNIIETYDWFILFDNEKAINENEIFNLENITNVNSTLIIGGPPHYYDKTKFFKSQLLQSYTEVYTWTMKFKEVYLYISGENPGEKKKLITYIDIVEIYLDEITVYAPPYYTNLMKREFFSKYPESCKVNKGENNIYYCIKSDNFTLNELKQFPTLYFYHMDFNYTFELTYQDLFAEYKGNYYFLVTDSDGENWTIGFPFLKKYQFFFNQDSRSVYFYNPNLPQEKEDDDEKEEEKEKEKEREKEKEKEKEGEKEKEKEGEKEKEKEEEDDHGKKNSTDTETNGSSGTMSIKSVILIVVISAIVFIALGLTFGYLCFRKFNKRIRANELEDNYDYLGSEDGNKKINY